MVSSCESIKNMSEKWLGHHRFLDRDCDPIAHCIGGGFVVLLFLDLDEVA